MPRAGSDREPKLRPTCWRSFVRPTHVARVVGRHWRPRGKRPGRASGGRPCVTRHGRHRTSPALHVTRKTRSRRLAVAPLHHGAPVAPWSTTMRRVLPPRDNGDCSAMAHPLTHLTHGISTRRPFHPAKTAKTPQRL